MDWEKLKKYKGKWVAIKDNEVIAVGDSAKEVLEKSKNICKKPTIFQVPKQEETYIMQTLRLNQPCREITNLNNCYLFEIGF